MCMETAVMLKGSEMWMIRDCYSGIRLKTKEIWDRQVWSR